MNAKCPYCGTEYTVDSSDFGKCVVCESCHKEFVIGQGNIRSSKSSRSGANEMNQAVGGAQTQIPHQVVVKKSWLEQTWYLMVLLAKAIVFLIFFNMMDTIASRLHDIQVSVDDLKVSVNNLEESSKQIYKRMGEMRVYRSY